MSSEPDNFERLKYEIERRKLELEEEKQRRENRFFTKNFAVVLTGIISTATIVVSLLQLQISSNNAAAQQEIERQKTEQNFAFEVAKFLMERRDEINTIDVVKAKYIRNVVISSFPPKIATQIATSMRDVSEQGEIRQVWADTVLYSQSNVTVATTTVVSAPTPGPTASRSTLVSDKLIAEFPNLSGPDKKKELDLILDKAKQAGIVEKNDLDIYVAILLHLSAGLSITSDILNYTSAQRLAMVWPQRFRSADDAEPYVRNPEKLANLVYDGRLGNTQPGDGYKYRGRGYFLTTGRSRYSEIGKALGVDLEEDPEKMLDPEINAQASAYQFSKSTATMKRAGPLDLVRVFVAINGGISGIDSVKSNYERIRKLTP